MAPCKYRLKNQKNHILLLIMLSALLHFPQDRINYTPSISPEGLFFFERVNIQAVIDDAYKQVLKQGNFATCRPRYRANLRHVHGGHGYLRWTYGDRENLVPVGELLSSFVSLPSNISNTFSSYTCDQLSSSAITLIPSMWKYKHSRKKTILHWNPGQSLRKVVT